MTSVTSSFFFFFLTPVFVRCSLMIASLSSSDWSGLLPLPVGALPVGELPVGESSSTSIVEGSDFWDASVSLRIASMTASRDPACLNL